MEAVTESAPRLSPIEHPKEWRLRLAYWFLHRRYGKVITPMKVIHARMPRSVRLGYEMSEVEHSLPLDDELIFLVKSHVASLNGCSFCVDIARATAVEQDVRLEKYDALPDFHTSPAFSERERAALAYAEEATLQKAVGEESFDALRQQFTEKEIAALTWLNAMENYYNLLNRPLEIGSDELCRLG